MLCTLIIVAALTALTASNIFIPRSSFPVFNHKGVPECFALPQFA